jgi:hypothetical protein
VPYVAQALDLGGLVHAGHLRRWLRRGGSLSVANGHLEQDSSLLLAFAAFMAVGAVVVAHRPGNAVGWIFSAVGL